MDDTEAHGPAIHVPEQGLHMRIVGRTAEGRAVHRGTLDTSMGVVTVETDGETSRAWARHARPYEVTEDMEGDERIVEAPDQTVAIAFDGEHETGTIATSGGDVDFMDRR